jgi:hypothetical protein
LHTLFHTTAPMMNHDAHVQPVKTWSIFTNGGHETSSEYPPGHYDEDTASFDSRA